MQKRVQAPRSRRPAHGVLVALALLLLLLAFSLWVIPTGSDPGLHDADLALTDEPGHGQGVGHEVVTPARRHDQGREQARAAMLAEADGGPPGFSPEADAGALEAVATAPDAGATDTEAPGPNLADEEAAAEVGLPTTAGEELAAMLRGEPAQQPDAEDEFNE